MFQANDFVVVRKTDGKTIFGRIQPKSVDWMSMIERKQKYDFGFYKLYYVDIGQNRSEEVFSSANIYKIPYKIQEELLKKIN